MKKICKNVKAVLMALVMILSAVLPALPAMAAETAQTTKFIISGIEEGSEVHAYAVALDAVDENGNHYWKYTKDGETKLSSAVSSGKISSETSIWLYTNLNSTMEANNHDGQGAAVVDGIVYKATEEDGKYIIDGVRPGLYVITAQKENGTVSYNFNIYAANYKYNAKGEAYLPSEIPFTVKSTSEPSIDKWVESDGADSKHGDAGIGDTVDFKIEVTVPDYSEEWNVDGTRFLIKDTLSDGLALKEDSITIAGTSLTDYTKLCAKTDFQTSTSGFTLDLHGADIYQYKGQTITIQYQAKVTDQAGVNFDAEKNTATIRWSNAPGSDDLSQPKDGKTYHYTFGIDTTVNGVGSRETTEVTKYGVKTTTVEDNKVNLDGAEFQLLDAQKNVLYFDDAGKLDPTKTENDHVTTKNGGRLTVTGLDAGTYYLRESKAPNGYALDKTEYVVTITPSYNELTGELKNYTVQIGNGSTNSITFKYEMNDNGDIDFSNDGTYAINNTPMAELPETGGAGIVVVTIAAVAMMAVFGSLFIALGKKKRS